MKYREPLPDNCPPPEAEEIMTAREVYRLVRSNPSMWNGGHEHQGAGVLFVIKSARETKQAGAAIFPEILRTEFHGISSVIEAYSRSASIEGMEQPHAAGYMVTKGDKTRNATLRVWSAGKSLEYRLDRWD